MKNLYAVIIHINDLNRNYREVYMEIYAEHAFEARCIAEQCIRLRGYIPGHNARVYAVKEVRKCIK